MPYPSVPVSFIYCSTGCSCCSNENHYRGPFKSAEVAQERVKRYHEIPILASQYAPSGRYEISNGYGELLPDGRIIHGVHVYPGIIDDENVAAGSDEEICDQ